MDGRICYMEKIRVVVIGSGHNAERFIEENKTNQYIEIVGLVPDNGFNNNKAEQYVSLLDGCDIGFALGYSRIIPPEICNQHFIINLHAGILPKWRGFSANAWAIMNSAQEIGYSLHRVSNTLDGGLLYYVKHIPIDRDQTMSDVHGIMIDSIIKDCPEILYRVAKKIIAGKEQEQTDIAYCTKFNVGMGLLKDFSREAEYYVNLYRCMAEPLGSGVSFVFRGEKYSIGKIEHGRKYGVSDYICSEGKIVNIQSGTLWVKVKDNVIVLSEIKKDGGFIELEKTFINGQLLVAD